jgi:uncharacterized protein
VTELQQLLAVQELDTRAEQLRYRKAHLPEGERLVATEKQIADLEREDVTAQEAAVALRQQQTRLETDIEVLRTKETSLSAQLAKSVVPKEAETFQTEITSTHARRTHLEDEELEVMEQLEPIDARLHKIVVEREVLTAQRTAESAAFTEACSAIDRELETDASQRSAAVAELPPSLIARYEKMRSHLGGVAVARLDHGTCLGCNVKLSNSEREAAMAAPANEPVECEQCGRLLVR